MSESTAVATLGLLVLLLYYRMVWKFAGGRSASTNYVIPGWCLLWLVLTFCVRIELAKAFGESAVQNWQAGAIAAGLAAMLGGVVAILGAGITVLARPLLSILADVRRGRVSFVVQTVVFTVVGSALFGSVFVVSGGILVSVQSWLPAWVTSVLEPRGTKLLLLLVLALAWVATIALRRATWIGFREDAVRAGFLLALVAPFVAALYGATRVLLRDQIPFLLVLTILTMGAANYWVFATLGGRTES